MPFGIFFRPRRARKFVWSPLYLAEPMECRLLLAGFTKDVGLLQGRFYRQGSVFGSDTDVYTFTIPSTPTVLTNFAKIDVQLSRLIGTGNMVLRSGSTVLTSTSKSSSDQELTFNPSSTGPFTLSVRADQSQLAPAVFYTLAITTDIAPQNVNTTLSAANAAPVGNGTLTEANRNRMSDFIGYFDTSAHVGKDLVDIYKLHVPAGGSLDIVLNLLKLTDPADSGAKVAADLRLFQDQNHDGILQGSETLKTVSTGQINLAEIIAAPLNAVDLFVVVSRLQAVSGTFGGSNYQLDFLYHVADLAGNTLADARQVTFGGVQTFNDYLSSVDTTDIYKFDARNGGPFSFSAVISGASGAFDLQLVEDLNLNGTVDSGEVLAGANHTSISEHFIRPLTVPDTYYLLVNRFSGEGVYTLSMANPSIDTAGNSIGTAKDLGALTSSLSVNGLVGPIDTADVFKISVANRGELRVNVTSPTNGAVAVDVINSNSILTTTLATLSTGHVLDGVLLPTAGSFFVRVRPNTASNVGYSMTLSLSKQTPFGAKAITISNSGASTVEAENFDNGGDPDAYHDNTADNDNGAARAGDSVDIKTTNDTGGGFRVTDTAVGEYLEYTVFVEQTGNYDIDFRASSPAAGAACHLEVDGTDVTGPVAIPSTGGFDTMQTVTKPTTPLTAGPHVLRLAFDAGIPSGSNAGFAGAYNFIQFRPSPSPGTFKLAPAHSTVAPGESDKLAITWTVPSGSWHLLHDIQLRLLAADGTRIKVRWNELENTLRLYDNTTHKYGAAKKIGSKAILSNQFVHLHLARSSVKASSPTSPTVTLTVDLRFTNTSSGKAFVLAVAANDDLGHHQDFQDAGYVVVS